MSKGNYQIPFDKDGNQQPYPKVWYVTHGVIRSCHHEGPNWRDNFEFDDTLTLIDYGRGRSSVTFRMQRTDGTHVEVFVSDFFEMAKQMHNGKIAGRFTFTKKGQNYGCKMVEAE